MKLNISQKSRYSIRIKLVLIVLSLAAIMKPFADGLPGEYILSDQWRTLFKYYSPLTNPALMMEQFYSSVRANASISPDEVSNLWEIGTIIPVAFYHTVGFTVVGENGKSVENWGLMENQALASSKNSNFLFVGSYALNPWRRLCLGININGAYQGNFGDSPTFKMGVDLGATYRLLLHPVLGFHLFGLTFQNIIAPDLNLYEKMPYAAKLKAYYRAKMLRNHLELDLQYDISDFTASNELFNGNTKQLEWNLGIQAGFWILPFLAVRGFTDFGDANKFEYIGLACELNVPQFNNARDFSFIYQYRNELQKNVSGSQSIYFRMEVGKNREEFRVRRIARTVSVGANELYNKALKQYYKNDFWGAYFTFTRLQTEFPDFFKNDNASYYAGSCLEELDMREEALKILQESKEKYPLSSMTPNTDLAMMRVYYRQGEYDLVSSQFAELNRMSVSDSIRMHGCYIMAEAELKRKEYKQAVQYFDLVKENHPVYVFAQHSAAVAYFNLDNQEMAVSCLENCIGVKGSTPAQKEMVNRSMVFLGLIFYEDDALSKAVSALSMVPPESYYREDALLGSAWTALKARQWKDCISFGAQLAQVSSKFVNKCEGALLQAYGHMMEKRYNDAKLLLDPVMEQLRSFSILTEDSLTTERAKYESDRISYKFLAENVSDAARKGASLKQGIMDSLHSIQIATKEGIDNYYLFEDDAGRRMFFERSLSKVQEDIEYALATITKIVNRVTETKVIDKIKDKDEEIQRLREEMEKLEGTKSEEPAGTEGSSQTSEPESTTNPIGTEGAGESGESAE